jgi:hypothetical protein
MFNAHNTHLRAPLAPLAQNHKRGVSAFVFAVAAFAATALFGGCALPVTQIIYHSPVELEKSCTVNFSGTLTVKNFDGVNVEWKTRPLTFWSSVRIPEGGHTFTMNYARTVRIEQYNRVIYERHHRNNIVASYDGFKAGRVYEIVAAEGGEARFLSGNFFDLKGMIHDNYHQLLRIGIRDITDDPLKIYGGFQWLPVTVLP